MLYLCRLAQYPGCNGGGFSPSTLQSLQIECQVFPFFSNEPGVVIAKCLSTSEQEQRFLIFKKKVSLENAVSRINVDL